MTASSNRRRARRGFTLMEVLLVLAILVILVRWPSACLRGVQSEPTSTRPKSDRAHRCAVASVPF